MNKRQHNLGSSMVVYSPASAHNRTLDANFAARIIGGVVVVPVNFASCGPIRSGISLCRGA